MGILARLKGKYLSWTRNTPMPPPDPEAPATFQSWHEFDTVGREWVKTRAQTETPPTSYQPEGDDASKITIATWNVDAGAPQHADRICALVAHVLAVQPLVDIICLQEVNKMAFNALMTNEEVRSSWFSSERDTSVWGFQTFATVTLASKTRFAAPDVKNSTPRLGAIWRTKLPSRYARDALCCDLLFPSTTSNGSVTRVRVVNVHLDSLAVNPSRRPRQIAIAAALIRCVGRGIIAGDFNPVLEEDKTLLEENKLTDVWNALRPGVSGFTWGADRPKRFPPNRLDKVAAIGLIPNGIEILKTEELGPLENIGAEGVLDGAAGVDAEPFSEECPAWSDHYGLHCTLRV